MSENDFQVQRTFFGGTVPGFQINASNGAIVKVVFNIVQQEREEDSVRKFVRWIEEEEAKEKTLAMAQVVA